MTQFEMTEAIKTLANYYIISELGDIIIEFDKNTKKAIALDCFPKDFDLLLKEKERYGISKFISVDKTLDINMYTFTKPEGILYFYEQYRNYIYKDVLNEINALEYMKESLKKSMIEQCNLDISNHTWMTNDEKNNAIYYETLNKTPEYLRILIDKFDKIINPFNKKSYNEEILKYTENINLNQVNKRKCTQFTIKDEYTRMYCRKEDGFIYTFIGKTRTNLCLGHHFKGVDNKDYGEYINIIISKNKEEIKIRYNLTNETIEINGNIRNTNESDIILLADILSDVIEIYKPEELEKIIALKKWN